jgi:hypothetical protein
MAGAAAVIRSHVRRCKTPGNRKPALKTVQSATSAGNSVGGLRGVNFDNKSLGK